MADYSTIDEAEVILANPSPDNDLSEMLYHMAEYGDINEVLTFYTGQLNLLVPKILDVMSTRNQLSNESDAKSINAGVRTLPMIRLILQKRLSNAGSSDKVPSFLEKIYPRLDAFEISNLIDGYKQISQQATNKIHKMTLAEPFPFESRDVEATFAFASVAAILKYYIEKIKNISVSRDIIWEI